ncbi:TPA: ParB/RepB/Spo0J family partition protein [Pseudomonas aeruginosa]
MTTKTIAGNMITDTALTALAGCNSLRSIHDAAKKLISSGQMGLDLEPKRNNAFDMPVALLVCNIDEAIRSEFDQEAVRGFADSYAAGDYVEPLGVVAENGKLRVVTGFTRYAGLTLAISEGADIKRIWVNQIEGGRANELVRQLVSNQQVQVSPLDLAESYRELIEDFGFTVAGVATAIRRKEHHVRKMLDLLKVAPEVQEMVANGQASVTTALNAERHCKATGQDTVVHMQEQLAQAQRNGSDKITPKSVAVPSALYGRKDIDVAAPILAKLADQLEQQLPFMASAPESVTLELTLTSAELNLPALAKALANLRAVFKSSQGGTAPAVSVG